MKTNPLTYAVVTAARDEAESLPVLAASLAGQSVPPLLWTIVENGSEDSTLEVAHTLASQNEWIDVRALEGAGRPVRGAPIVRAFQHALPALNPRPNLIANVDADVSFGVDFFQRLLAEFERRPSLGIASGSAWELERGEWRQRFVTGATAWGATRTYRWECLQDVLPLEARHGWDGADELKARARGWETGTLIDLPFRHHRAEGARDGSRWRHWSAIGDSAHFLGYRPWYVAARTLHHVRREPSAIAILSSYAWAAVRRQAQLADPQARALLRREQTLRNLPRRRREALGQR